MSDPRTRVLVIEDSITVRRAICDALQADSTLEVVGEGADGKRAIELCAGLRPDVVTMDLTMPIMSGLAATEYIMAHCPTPILIVSGSTNRGELFRTYDALAAGAVDVLEKPRGDEPGDSWSKQLIRTVKLVSRIKVITHPRARLRSSDIAPLPALQPTSPRTHRAPRVVALGASTGGPGALARILKSLPPGFSTPILIVMHIGAAFGAAFADWLAAESGRDVRRLAGGERLAELTGRVGFAPPGFHLVSRGGRLHLTEDPELHSCRPSIDVLFESLAADFGDSVTAVLLTGMGRDGAAGLLSIRRRGGQTIAQDEASSVVYGMPREAILVGAAERVLSLDEIGPALAGIER